MRKRLQYIYILVIYVISLLFSDDGAMHNNEVDLPLPIFLEFPPNILFQTEGFSL